MKNQLTRLQQSLSTQAELIHSMVGEMAIIRREAAMCREMTNLLLSVLIEQEGPMKPMVLQTAPVNECFHNGWLDPRRLP